MRRLSFWVLATAMSVLVLAIMLVPVQMVVVSHQGTPWLAFHAGEGSTFQVRWTHSVEKEPWEETFRVEGRSLYVISTRFKTFGAGVPAQAGDHTTLEDGWVVMRGLHRRVDPLYIQAAPREHYLFQQAGDTWSLDVSGRDAVIHIQTVNAPPGHYLAALLRPLWSLESS
ncbi:DUF1850 domain-containing protein [Larsenimonas rhizosphaerae]|uniref:DUF1850 domain-containing protein n=1 Tax=Larsenimonas rhizosphaerae TaxID=2944682 RepID=A0AA41ZHW9_9GAMM|nr:DUF1850 domain-containing protein [Larsenimonas rhizosphaerae]MCM2129814.1 DUF1850 domain-containing protein [Larsenimonas rhizosphaerae]MCX2524474.1 DUF1850 domain-containing protein [Larsenimonas rhizosphaerae]